MSFREQRVVAVVPARGGSKSIPGKNMQSVDGLSLIARAAQLCTQLDWLDYAVLSSDDPKMITEGQTFGLQAPFLRPDVLSGDRAQSIDVWRHAVLECEAIVGHKFDIALLLEPTCPLRKVSDVEVTINALIDSNCDSAVTVSPTPAHFTPHKTLEISEDQRLEFYHSDGAAHSSRQTIPAYYHRNGACYAMRREPLINRNEIIGNACVPVILHRPLVNIDEPYELELANWLVAREKQT